MKDDNMEQKVNQDEITLHQDEITLHTLSEKDALIFAPPILVIGRMFSLSFMISQIEYYINENKLIDGISNITRETKYQYGITAQTEGIKIATAETDAGLKFILYYNYKLNQFALYQVNNSELIHTWDVWVQDD